MADEEVTELIAKLNSRHNVEKLDGLKTLLRWVSFGKNMAELLPQVTKCVVSTNLEVKRLSYIFVSQYAEQKPDETLLSINIMQSDLQHEKPLVRALALRTLCSIRTNVIVQLQVMAVNKSVNDISPYVRACAAHAMIKVCRLDEATRSEMLPKLKDLLSDRAAMVVSAALAAFVEIAPDNLELLHPCLQKFCLGISEFDEWGQVSMLRLFKKYAVAYFHPDLIAKNINDQYPCDVEELKHDEKSLSKSQEYLDLLIRSTSPLVISSSPAVALQLCDLYLSFSIAADENFRTMDAVIKALIFHVHTSTKEFHISLIPALSRCLEVRRHAFDDEYQVFFYRANDPGYIRLCKIEALVSLTNDINVVSIVSELQEYIRAENVELVQSAITAIGELCRRFEKIRSSCIRGLLNLLCHWKESIASSVAFVLLNMLGEIDQKHIKNEAVVPFLVRSLGRMGSSEAKATTLFLLGKFLSVDPESRNFVLEGLRKIAKEFKDIANEDVKLQAISLAVQVIISPSDEGKLLARYVLDLGLYDASCYVRDKAQQFNDLLSYEGEEEASEIHQKLLAMFEANIPNIEFFGNDSTRFEIASLSSVVGHKAPGSTSLLRYPGCDLPPLQTSIQRIDLKEASIPEPPVKVAAQKGPATGLDDFFNGEDSENDNDEDNSDEYTDDSEEDEDEEEE